MRPSEGGSALTSGRWRGPCVPPPRPILLTARPGCRVSSFCVLRAGTHHQVQGPSLSPLPRRPEGDNVQLFHSFHFAWSSFTFSGLHGGEVFGLTDIGGQVVRFPR